MQIVSSSTTLWDNTGPFPPFSENIPIPLFPQEITEIIVGHMTTEQVRLMAAVSKIWHQFAMRAFLFDVAFGKAKWNTHFGDIGEEPPLPLDIYQILSSPCPFWPGKKVAETHMLVLIPKTVNGQILTLKNLSELIKQPKQGNSTQFSPWNPGGNENLTVASSYWLLMTRDVLEGTRKKPYAEQTKIITAFCQKVNLNYQPPKLLEAAVCILMEYVSHGTRLYSDSPATYTRCEEKYEETDYPMVIGGFASGGLVVVYSCSSFFDVDSYGLACVRKLGT